MLAGTTGLFAMIALVEWALWRTRRRRHAEIDAFMEWHSYPEPAAPPEAMPGHVQVTGVGHPHAQLASETGELSRI